MEAISKALHVETARNGPAIRSALSAGGYLCTLQVKLRRPAPAHATRLVRARNFPSRGPTCYQYEGIYCTYRGKS